MAQQTPDEARAQLRRRILDPAALVRGLATGRHRGSDLPYGRVELRYVDLTAGRRLQVVRYDHDAATTTNHDAGEAPAVLDELLALPFANWHVRTADEQVQAQFTRKGRAILTIKRADEPVPVVRDHDRTKKRLLPAADPVFAALGLTDDAGRVLPSRTAKFTQVQDFLATLEPVTADAVRLARPAGEQGLEVADLGCGNAYLTFAAARFLEEQLPRVRVRVTGVDARRKARERNAAIAADLGMGEQVHFVDGRIGDVDLDPAPDVVLALHACDTATDDALARAVQWGAGVILAAPCCHRDVQRQLRSATPSPSQRLLTRYGILTERLADTLTDAFRAALLRLSGYRVDVVEFVEAGVTPRNTMIRAVRTGAVPDPDDVAAYRDLTATWQVTPALERLLPAAARTS